jgi:hypothetical protein
MRPSLCCVGGGVRMARFCRYLLTCLLYLLTCCFRGFYKFVLDLNTIRRLYAPNYFSDFEIVVPDDRAQRHVTIAEPVEV